MNSGIYVIRNIQTDDFYIGSSSHITSRLYQHFCALMRGKHPNPRLQRAYNRDGKEAFVGETIALMDKASALACEDRMLRLLVGRSNCYNVHIRAIGAVDGRKLTDEHRMKIGFALKGKKREPHTDATKQKLREKTLTRSVELSEMAKRNPALRNLSQEVIDRRATSLRAFHIAHPGYNRGHEQSPEAIAKQRESNRHYTSSEQCREWARNLGHANRGRHMGEGQKQRLREAGLLQFQSPEARVLAGAANKGRKRSPETIAKWRESMLRRLQPNER